MSRQPWEGVAKRLHELSSRSRPPLSSRAQPRDLRSRLRRHQQLSAKVRERPRQRYHEGRGMQMKGTIRLVLAAAMLLDFGEPGARPGGALRRKDHGRSGPGSSARYSEHGQDRPAVGPAAASRCFVSRRDRQARQAGRLLRQEAGHSLAGLLPVPDPVHGRSEWPGRRTRDGEPDPRQRLPDRHRQYRSGRNPGHRSGQKGRCT